MSEKLVVFFSRRGENYAVGNISEGNAEHIAKVIKKLTDADIFEIRTKRQYSADYMTCVNEAKAELEKEERPELLDLPKSIDGYSDIFLCFPNWWGTFPRAVASFLEKYNFKDKTIWPLCTHEGSGMGKSEAELRKIAAGANVKSGLAIKGTDARTSDEKIRKWLGL